MIIYQPINGYRYNSDSIFLYRFAAKFNPKGKVLDVGCGVGVLSLLLGRDYGIELTAVDKQREILDYAEANFKANRMQATLLHGDFLELSFKDRFDFIISNPPFYDPRVSQSNFKSINISRYSHHLPFDKFAKKVKEIISPRGYFIFCYDSKQIDLVLHSLAKHKLKAIEIRFVHSKLDRDSKIVMVAVRAGSKSSTKVSAPLVVFDKSGDYTDEAAKAFEAAATHSITAQF